MSRHAASNPPYRPRYQWEENSGTDACSQMFNCGPTGSTQQADYYRGNATNPVLFGIEDTRVLGADRCRPTNAWEQASMLTQRGAPARAVTISSLDQFDQLLGDGHRPIGVGIEMSRLRATTRGHDFQGWHRVTFLKRATRLRTINGVRKRRRGYIYTDPNFHPPGGYRPDPKRGHRWISRREFEYAFIQNSPAYAILPEYRKA